VFVAGAHYENRHSGPYVLQCFLRTGHQQDVLRRETHYLLIGNVIGFEERQDEFPDLSQVKMEETMASPAEFQQLNPRSATTTTTNNIDLLLDVKMPVSIELGRTDMPISEILTLGPGSIVELDKLAGEPVDLLVNDKIIAKGEVVVVDENFGVRITMLMSPEERLKSLAQH